MSSRIENLGYKLTSYNPCVDWNADNFCCSNRGAAFRQNVLQSNCKLTPTTDYSRSRNFGYGDDRTPQWIKPLGIAEPQEYNFNPVSLWNIWCGRTPCTIDATNKPPCQANMPVYNKPTNCGCGSGYNSKGGCGQ